MAAPVYSTRFLGQHALSGAATYTVPAGYRAVLRDLDVVVAPTGGCNIQLAIGFAMLWIVELGMEGQFTYETWRGRQVANSGENIVFSSTDFVDYCLSGYLLTLP